MAEEIDLMDKWGELVENAITTAWYRVMSFNSLHAPLMEIYEVCQRLSTEKYNGEITWLLDGRVFRWSNITVDTGVKMDLRIWGRGKNTVFARVGWWKMYVLDAVLSRANVLLKGVRR